METKGKYEGDLNNGLKEGTGTYTWTNGNKYTGEFTFVYKGLELTGTIENHPEFTNEKGCILNEGEPYCNFSQLNDLIAYING